MSGINPGICIDSKYNLRSDTVKEELFIRGVSKGSQCVSSYSYTCSWVSGQEYWKGSFSGGSFTAGSDNSITANFDFNCDKSRIYNCGEAKIEVTYKKCCPDGYQYDSASNSCKRGCEGPQDCGVCTEDKFGIGNCNQDKEGRKGDCVDNVCEWDPCQPNEGNCAPDYCCADDSNGPKTGTGKCEPLKTTVRNYLCASSSPGSWVKCDENNLNVEKDIEGDKYKCVYENEEYKWVISPESESFKAETPSENILTKILNFLRSLFG